ncbi:MAG: hypothetical protein ACKVRN_03435 [Pyrinomonadaceae bacterium]
METAKTQITLASLAVGSRLLVRSRLDWRFAAVSKVSDDRIVLTVCSPTGRTYRLRREREAQILIEGTIPILPHDKADDWRENFSRYDHRW